MAGAQVVIDLANSPSFEDKAVLEFFETSSRNLLAAEAAAGVRNHVALSIVGTDRTPDNGYFRRQGRPRETDRGLRHPLHHHPLASDRADRMAHDFQQTNLFSFVI